MENERKLRGQFESAQDVRDFVFAGKAKLTLVSKVTGARFTYRIKASKERPYIKFVSVLTGNDNMSSYSYLGYYKQDVYFYGVSKSKIGSSAASAQAWNYFHEVVIKRGVMPNPLEIWHEGRCGRCGRVLTVPESVERGIGPECIHHLHAA